LFGGFDERFYTSYNAVFPMESGWESRMDICNLYPLMVHVNLFGGAYLSQVNAILDKFTA
jgi:fructosamine-3-kinase